MVKIIKIYKAEEIMENHDRLYPEGTLYIEGE